MECSVLAYWPTRFGAIDPARGHRVQAGALARNASLGNACCRRVLQYNWVLAILDGELGHVVGIDAIKAAQRRV